MAKTNDPMDDVTELVIDIRNVVTNRVTTLENRLDSIETTINRPGGIVGGGSAPTTEIGPKALALFNQVTGANLTSEGLRDYDAAWLEYMRRGPAASHDVRNTLQVGTDSDGGFWVSPQRTARIIAKMYETSPMRRLAFTETIGSDALEGLIDNDEAESGWVSEMGDRDETDSPEIGEFKVPLHEQYAMPVVTQKLLDTAGFDVSGWLDRKIAQKLGRTEVTAFYAGNASGKPRGFLDYPTATTADSSRAWGTLQYVVTGHASTFATPTTSISPADCLITLQQSLKAEYRANARWQMNKATAGAVRKFKDADGRFIWTDNIQAGQPPLLLGDPVEIAADMPDVGANTFPIAYGDWKQAYTIVDHIVGIRTLRDPFTTKGRVKFYTTKRVGGGLLNSEAIRLLKVSE